MAPATSCEQRVEWISEKVRERKKRIEGAFEGVFYPTYDQSEKDAKCVVNTVNGRWKRDPKLKDYSLEAQRGSEGYDYSIERK